MGLVLAAAPYEDFVRDNIPVFVLVMCLILALLVLRLVVKMMTRALLLGILTLTMLFVYVERDNIEVCARTCECTLAGFDTSVPGCNPRPI